MTQGSVLKTAALGVLMAFSTAAYARDINGEYLANGTSANGETYSAIVTIEAKGDAYLIHWKLEKAGYDGVGMLEGDKLSVAWTYNGKPGVAIYKVDGDKLVGHWTVIEGGGKVLPETLTKR